MSYKFLLSILIFSTLGINAGSDSESDVSESCILEVGTLENPKFTKSVVNFWLRNWMEKRDFFVIEDVRNDKKQLLGSRGKSFPLVTSSQDIYDKYYFLPDSKIVMPADPNRKVAEISWSTVHNCDTDGPIIDIDPAVECKLQQIFLDKKKKVPALHMQCIAKNEIKSKLKNPEHDFFIYMTRLSSKNKNFVGEASFEGELYTHPDGYTVVEKSHEFEVKE